MTRRAYILLAAAGVIFGLLLVLSLLERSEQPVSPDAFTAWAKQYAIPIKTVEAGHGFDDLQPLKQIVGKARVVGMGEATHGTREFFQFKHRMFEFLVEEMGFTAFGIEASFPDAADVNDYVLGGDGDAAKLVNGMRFWTWDTEEVLALVEWMRLHNLKPTTKRKVKFYGFDMQFPEPAVEKALAYLKNPDQKLADECTELLKLVHGIKDGKADKQLRRQAKASAEKLAENLEKNHAHLTQARSEADWSFARQNVEIAIQALNDGDDAFRDKAMAQNAEWILREEGPQGKVMLWAHNGHVAYHVPERDVRLLGWRLMGGHLRKSLGSDYVALGLLFNQGSFQARSGLGAKMPLQSFTVGPAPPGTADAVMTQVGLPIFVLNLRTASKDSAAAPWVCAETRTRDVGSMFSKRAGQTAESLTRIILSEAFDAVIFMEKTTSARPNLLTRKKFNMPEPVEQ